MREAFIEPDCLFHGRLTARRFFASEQTCLPVQGLSRYVEGASDPF
jgi:hypothetical protein